MTPPDPYPYATPPPALGPLLAHLRLARGWSQLRLAEQLCAASGVPTISRHEISRWERQQRIPGDFWLGWLANVLEAPFDELATAAAGSRLAAPRIGTLRLAGHPAAGPYGWSAAEPSAGLARRSLLDLAHAWLADPTGPPFEGFHPTGPLFEDSHPTGPPSAGCDPAASTAQPPASTAQPPASGLIAADLAELRRLDDLVGGVDLVQHGRARLEAAARAASRVERGARRRTLPLLAEAGQFAGWLAADAGDGDAALDAYRWALMAAGAAGDRPLAAYVLGSASHLLAGTGDPEAALILARTGHAGARRAASAGVRALLLHRVAFAAALCGRHRAAHAALGAAQRAADRRDPGCEPPWLYWLDDGELAAMTGRCLAALRRPLRAEPLLAAARRRAGPRRTSAIYAAWLARAYLHLGELEQACEVADAALLDAVRAGSARAAAELDVVRRRLAPHRDDPAVRRHTALVNAARPYLAGPPHRADRSTPGMDRPVRTASRPTSVMG
jgi:transcriptional regulator with XRE-family HTH domain